MRLFKDVKGYANEKNAIKKLLTVFSCENEEELNKCAIWSIGYNGRFYPVVHSVRGTHSPSEKAMLAHSGVCVTN